MSNYGTTSACKSQVFVEATVTDCFTSPLIQPPEFQAKYNQLLNVIDSRTRRPVTESFGAPVGDLDVSSTTGGGVFKFEEGGLYQFDNTRRIPIVAIWGRIKGKHDEVGGTDSGYGRPLTDVVDLSDGGRCAIFEGGHIHEYGDKAMAYVLVCVFNFVSLGS